MKFVTFPCGSTNGSMHQKRDTTINVVEISSFSRTGQDEVTVRMANGDVLVFEINYKDLYVEVTTDL